MESRTVAGLVGALVVVVVAAIGVYGFASGFLLETGGDYFGPSMGVLAVTVLAVGALIALGAGSRRWRQNPYW